MFWSKIKKLNLKPGEITNINIFANKDVYGEEISFEIIQVVHEDVSYYSDEQLRFINLDELKQSHLLINNDIEENTTIKKYWNRICHSHSFNN